MPDDATGIMDEPEGAETVSVRFATLLDQISKEKPIDNKDFINQVERINDFARSSLPHFLYRYRRCDERAIEMLRTDNIFMPRASTFNDPYDSTVYIDKQHCFDEIDKYCNIDVINNILALLDSKEVMNRYSQEDIEKFRKALCRMKDDPDKTLEDFKNSVSQKIKRLINDKQSMHCLCFSESPDSPMMWAHYADYSKGFVCAYDFKANQPKCSCTSSELCKGGFLFDFYPVMYGTHRYDATSLVPLLLSKPYRMGSLSMLPDSYDLQLQLNALLRKAIDWEHEHEWRVSVPTCADSASGEVYMHARPSSVYLGAAIDENNEDEIRRVATEKGVELYKMGYGDSPEYRLIAKMV